MREDTAESTVYFRREDGSLSRMVTTTPLDDVVLPDGAEVITEAEHAAVMEEMTLANDAYLRGLRETEERQQVEDYEALIALRVPEATARRLTGHVMEEV